MVLKVLKDGYDGLGGLGKIVGENLCGGIEWMSTARSPPYRVSRTRAVFSIPRARGFKGVMDNFKPQF